MKARTIKRRSTHLYTSRPTEVEKQLEELDIQFETLHYENDEGRPWHLVVDLPKGFGWADVQMMA